MVYCLSQVHKMASASADVALSKKVFDKAVNSALGKVNTGIARLTEQQLKALKNFLSGKDSFVCLPTGHGKSLIYQLCPVVVRELSSAGLEQFPTDPIVVVISPLNSLIADQIGSCEKLGIKACKVDARAYLPD